MCYSDCAGGESRTGISLSIPSLTLKWLFYFFISSFTGTVECANVHVVPKQCFICYYIITLYSFRTTLGCRKDLLPSHTGGTAGAIFNVLGCQFRDPVLVEIRSKNSFYGHTFPSAVSIRATK